MSESPCARLTLALGKIRDVNTREMARNVDRNECCVNFNREFWFNNFFEDGCLYGDIVFIR